MHKHHFTANLIAAMLIASTDLSAANAAPASTFTVLHSFAGSKHDGANPTAPLILDNLGNLFGTTYRGGTRNRGTLFKINKSRESIIKSFVPDVFPEGALAMDSAGNIYGTTRLGPGGNGTVFKVAANGVLTALHVFAGGIDGRIPFGGVTLDAAGNLYGGTYFGGTSKLGVTYRLAPDGTETILHTFSGSPDGSYPLGAVIRDSVGNLYGTAYGGGLPLTSNGCVSTGCGVIYKIAVDGTYSVLYQFKGGADGGNPEAGLVFDGSGNLYGTTEFGGAANDGTVFKLSLDGTETILYSFTGGSDGEAPTGSLVFDSSSNLIGTTFGRGIVPSTVFKLTLEGALTTIHTFSDVPDGQQVQEGVTLDGKGNIFGTAVSGGANGVGTVFEIVP